MSWRKLKEDLALSEVGMSQDDAAIKVEALSKHYGQLRALQGISFEVHRGEFFGLLGPNGAGKTTMVRILTGVIRADGGRAFVLGHEAGSLPAKWVAGVMPEVANPYLDLSGWNNLMLMAELYNVPRRAARKRATQLLEQVGLLERKDDPARGYSRGMKQRLLLCLALISDPEVLFLDEPTSGLDVQSSRLIKALLRQLNAQGKTIFLTTHNLEEANRLCDRVAIIDRGKLVALDAPQRLRLATRHRHSVEVSFADRVNPEALGKLPGVERVERVGDKYRLYTSDPGELVVSLVNYSCRQRCKIISLSTLAPSLEDAFLAFTEGA